MASTQFWLSRRAIIGGMLAMPAALHAPRSFAGDITPAGQILIAWHVTLSPAWYEPSLAPPQITPFGMLYALHEALVRAYPGEKMAGPRRIVAGE
jgi:peptide/nickel transport system substrate-binding protein